MTRKLPDRLVLSGDEGMGMLLVIGVLGLVSALVAVAGTIAVTTVKSSNNRVTYEQALATAENGVDYGLSQLQKAFDDTNSDWPTPAPAAQNATSGCNLAQIPQLATTDAAQKVEARTNLRTIALTPACLRQGAVGQYVIWKPATPLVNGLYPKYGKVYAMSFVPRYDPTNPHMKSRLLKAEYLFMPYRPTNAVLTGGNLSFDSSTRVTTAYGLDPSEASVHTNGTVSVSGNPTVTGLVSSTGSSTAQSNNFTSAQNVGGAVIQTPTQRIPLVRATGLYAQARNGHPEYATYSSSTVFDASTYIGPWYDLCSDGFARARSTGDPCTSSVTLNPGNQNSFRGWTYLSGTHVWKASNTTQSGIYYIDKGSVDVGVGNGSIANITVIAGAENPDDCTNKRYGNITWDHYDMKAPSFTNLFMYADSDISTSSNWSAGQGVSSPPVISGMFVAGDQMHMETSSAGAVGSLVVGDQCSTGNPDIATTNEIKNPNIYYDPFSDAPFTSIISTTLWLEYVG
jgi:hypothetical protein